jgi:hypothetical protein
MSTRTCSICGSNGNGPSTRWFLVVENSWEDKLTILEWNEQFADLDGVRQACSVAHVQEMVVHWMTMGSLDFPFAELRLIGKARPLRTRGLGVCEIGTSVRPIGELAVHRESMQRVLSESPHSLKVILDALLAALRRECPELPRDPEVDQEAPESVTWEV